MLVRTLRACLPALLVLAARVPAQTPPRHESKATLGDVTVTVEHGQPPWSEDRIGAIGQIPPGFPWRMGSENLTTIKIDGGPIFFGDKLVRPGRYGFNLTRVGTQDWAYTVFEPTHESDPNYFTLRGDEPSQQQIPAKFQSDATPSAEALTIDVTGDAKGGSCVLAWGPLRVSAPIIPVRITTSAININGYDTITSWYTRPLAEGVDLTQPILAGNIPLKFDESEDCSMNVYVMLKDDQLCAELRNVEREQWERDNALMGDRRKQLQAALDQFGAQAEGQIRPLLKDLDLREARNEVNLEMSTRRPDKIEIHEKAYDGSGAGLRAELVKSRGGLRLDISLGAKTAVLSLDESLFALKADG
jgi:hypothetical protein